MNDVRESVEGPLPVELSVCLVLSAEYVCEPCLAMSFSRRVCVCVCVCACVSCDECECAYRRVQSQ